VHKVMDASATLTDELSHKFENTDFGHMMCDRPKFKKAVEVGKAGFLASAAVLDGMVNALFVLGKGISDTTTQIVKKKYGEKMGEVVKDGLDSVGNVASILKSYQSDIPPKNEDEFPAKEVERIEIEHDNLQENRSSNVETVSKKEEQTTKL